MGDFYCYNNRLRASGLKIYIHETGEKITGDISRTFKMLILGLPQLVRSDLSDIAKGLESDRPD